MVRDLNSIVVLFIWLLALSIFGYFLGKRDSKRLVFLCFFYFLCSGFVISQLTSLASLEFRFLLTLGGLYVFVLALILLYSWLSKTAYLYFSFWILSTLFSFLIFLILIDPMFNWYITNSSFARNFFYFLIDLSGGRINYSIINLKMAWDVITCVSIILAFLVILFVEGLVYRSLKKKPSPKKGL
jgi:hypothetical protein